MRPSLVLAGCVLVAGMILSFVLGVRRRTEPAIYLPFVALASGPLWGVAFWFAATFFSSYYVSNEERFDELPSFLAIGIVCGIIGMFALVILAGVSHRRAEVDDSPSQCTDFPPDSPEEK